MKRVVLVEIKTETKEQCIMDKVMCSDFGWKRDDIFLLILKRNSYSCHTHIYYTFTLRTHISLYIQHLWVKNCSKCSDEKVHTTHLVNTGHTTTLKKPESNETCSLRLNCTMFCQSFYFIYSV